MQWHRWCGGRDDVMAVRDCVVAETMSGRGDVMADAMAEIMAEMMC